MNCISYNFKGIRIYLLLMLPFMGGISEMSAQFQDGQKIALQSALNDNFYIAPRLGSGQEKAYVSIHSGRRVRSSSYWTLKSAGDGYFYLRCNGLYMDVKWGSSKARTSVWMYNKLGSEAQKFKFRSAGNGYYYIVPKVNPSLVLDVKYGQVHEGSGIWTHPLNRTKAQKFKVEVIDQSTPLKRYRIIVKSFICAREDDPGREIEMYGHLDAAVYYRGKDYRVPEKKIRRFWYRSEHNPIDLHINDKIYEDRGQGPAEYGYFFVPEADFNEGKVQVSLSQRLWEHDTTSDNDRFQYDGLTAKGMTIYSSAPGYNNINLNFGQFIVKEGGTKVYIVWGIIPEYSTVYILHLERRVC